MQPVLKVNEEDVKRIANRDFLPDKYVDEKIEKAEIKLAYVLERIFEK